MYWIKKVKRQVIAATTLASMETAGWLALIKPTINVVLAPASAPTLTFAVGAQLVVVTASFSIDSPLRRM